jgi:hypothetical protein
MNYSSRTLVNPTNNQLMCTNLSYMGPHLVSTSHRNNGQRESSPNGLVSGWWLTRVYLRSMKLNIVFMRSFLPTLFEDASIITFFWWLNVANQNNQVFRGWSHPHDNCTFHQTGYIYIYVYTWYILVWFPGLPLSNHTNRTIQFCLTSSAGKDWSKHFPYVPCMAFWHLVNMYFFGVECWHLYGFFLWYRSWTLKIWVLRETKNNNAQLIPGDGLWISPPSYRVLTSNDGDG